jgi:hypothetical protein
MLTFGLLADPRRRRHGGRTDGFDLLSLSLARSTLGGGWQRAARWTAARRAMVGPNRARGLGTGSLVGSRTGLLAGSGFFLFFYQLTEVINGLTEAGKITASIGLH